MDDGGIEREEDGVWNGMAANCREGDAERTLEL